MSSLRARLKPVVVGVVLLIGSPFVVRGAEADTQDWQFGVMLYGWLPSVTGDLSYSLPPPALAVTASASMPATSSMPYRWPSWRRSRRVKGLGWVIPT